jgi:hypothetical protein
VYDEEFVSRTSVFEWHKSSKKGSESVNAKIVGESNVYFIFLMLKVSFMMSFCQKNRL